MQLSDTHIRFNYAHSRSIRVFQKNFNNSRNAHRIQELIDGERTPRIFREIVRDQYRDRNNKHFACLIIIVRQ